MVESEYCTCLDNCICSKPWKPLPVTASERIQSQIKRWEDSLFPQYSLAILQFQRIWGRIARLLFRGIILLLCRFSLLPFSLICRVIGEK